jgi:hypothetical protein
VTVLVFDKAPDRANAWRTAGFKREITETELLTALNSFRDGLVLVHTSDTDTAYVEGVGDYAANLMQFETRFRLAADMRSIALVYFSGAPNGAAHLERLCAPTGVNSRFHHYVVRWKIDGRTAAGFTDRVKTVAQDWARRLDANAFSAPEWGLLTYDWLDEAVEFVFSLGLGLPGSMDRGPLANAAVMRGLDSTALAETQEEQAQRARETVLDLVSALRQSAKGAERPAPVEDLLRSLLRLQSGEAREDAGKQFRRERTLVSHDLFKNEFGACLQPGWDAAGDDRLRARDIVVRAISGEAEAQEVVHGAVRVWTERVEPALLRFLALVETELGFVTTPAFQEGTATAVAAGKTIRSVLNPGIDPVEGARAFWQACTDVGVLLSGLGDRPYAYLARWDPSTSRRGLGT